MSYETSRVATTMTIEFPSAVAGIPAVGVSFDGKPKSAEPVFSIIPSKVTVSLGQPHGADSDVLVLTSLARVMGRKVRDDGSMSGFLSDGFISLSQFRAEAPVADHDLHAAIVAAASAALPGCVVIG